ncbi:MAG: ROK family protein [Chloroflexota bacterium]|nr:ROK family protein [Chloroflexota bacterium]
MSAHDPNATQEGDAVGTWIGVDVGGTKIDGVLIDAAGGIIAQHGELSRVDEGADAVVERIASVIARLLADAGGRAVHGIGVGCPGQVDGRAGVVRAAVNMGWQDLPLRAMLVGRLGANIPPIVLANDVNALTLGETRFGAARALRDVVYLAIGTGFGGGAVIDGRLLTGDNDFAMEVGHVVLRPGGRRCACGLRGCPEAYTSGVGLMNGIHAYLGDYPTSPLAGESTLTVPTILRAARGGDPLALLVVTEAADMLGTVMAICASTLNPEMIVIGGGLGKAAADLLLPRAESLLRERALPPSVERVRIVMASLERAAVGAAALTMG